MRCRQDALDQDSTPVGLSPAFRASHLPHSGPQPLNLYGGGIFTAFFSGLSGVREGKKTPFPQ